MKLGKTFDRLPRIGGAMTFVAVFVGALVMIRAGLVEPGTVQLAASLGGKMLAARAASANTTPPSATSAE